MSKYVVVWAEPGELSPVKNRKIFANIALIAKVFIYTFAQFYV